MRNTKKLRQKQVSTAELYTRTADFSQLRSQKAKLNMAEIEAILVRQFQSPHSRVYLASVK